MYCYERSAHYLHVYLLSSTCRTNLDNIAAMRLLIALDRQGLPGLGKLPQNFDPRCLYRTYDPVAPLHLRLPQGLLLPIRSRWESRKSEAGHVEGSRWRLTRTCVAMLCVNTLVQEFGASVVRCWCATWCSGRTRIPKTLEHGVVDQSKCVVLTSMRCCARNSAPWSRSRMALFSSFSLSSRALERQISVLLVAG